MIFQEYLLVMGMGRGVYYTHHLAFALMKALPATIAVSVLIIIDEVRKHLSIKEWLWTFGKPYLT